MTILVIIVLLATAVCLFWRSRIIFGRNGNNPEFRFLGRLSIFFLIGLIIVGTIHIKHYVNGNGFDLISTLTIVGVMFLIPVLLSVGFAEIESRFHDRE